ncbi:hypothetical protein ACFSYG_09615 [Leeuwenhoekiella polynyae]|uniref:Uncharacterized protein n=1 Tax=Leeuwenhoekiella polynyae TaxID=1550906 RepID=A0A4Q0PGK2_9FLAO|nr:hypothetical protein [Leeuwenhoekiella polynyae]RXG26025.1 hypothetical protein DSM02_16 [Leeuwenhoekiella polynyae]
MNTINLGEFRLDFQAHFIKLKINDGGHFDSDSFQNCLDLKSEIYGSRKLGLLITNEDKNDYSIDPLFLIKDKLVLEDNFKWIIVVSNKNPDYTNFEYFKRLTSIPCKFVTDFKEVTDHDTYCVHTM